jgi:hypothetical protein
LYVLAGLAWAAREWDAGVMQPVFVTEPERGMRAPATAALAKNAALKAVPGERVPRRDPAPAPPRA